MIAWLKKYWAVIAGAAATILGALGLFAARDRRLKNEGAEDERRRQAKAAAAVTAQIQKSDQAIDVGVAKRREGRIAEAERIKAETDEEAAAKWQERIKSSKKEREQK